MRGKIKTSLMVMTVTVVALLLLYRPVLAQSATELMGQSDCLACHDVAVQKVGPSFKDIALKYKSDTGALQMLVQAVKDGGVGRWGQMPMPPHATLSEDTIRQMVSWVLSQGEGNNSQKFVAAAQTTEVPLTEGAINKGRDYFTGAIPFGNSGPSCLSCHHVAGEGVPLGGALAKDLTQAYSRLGLSGIRSIIETPPFPAMKSSYQDHKLLPDEIVSLMAFLQHSDGGTEKKSATGVQGFLMGGIGGAVVFFGLIGIFGARRKKKSVNQEIFDRQVKSE